MGTINTLPDATTSNFNTALQDFLSNEDAQRFIELHGLGLVFTGGIHGTAAGLTGTPSALTAYPAGFRIQETGSITYADSSTTYVICHKDTTTVPTGFTRVSGTHYCIATGSRPTLPANSIWLMDVTTSGGAITAVTDRRRLAQVPTALRSKTVPPTVNDDASVGINVGDMWLDTTNDQVHQCIDDTFAAAVWVNLTTGGGGVDETDTNSTKDKFISNLLAKTFNDWATLMTTRGDIVYRDASGNARLAAGSEGQALVMGANDPGWNALTLVSEGRLTLSSGNPVTTSDQADATTVYYTPYVGNNIYLYDTSATVWRRYVFTEVSLVTSGTTQDLPHDVWIYDNSGTLTLEFLAWTNTTTRATALTRQNGVYVKTGDASRRYLGTFFSRGASKYADSTLLRRNLWNYYHRIPQTVSVTEATDTWDYNSVYRQVRNTDTNEFTFVHGVLEQQIEVEAVCIAKNNTATNVSFNAGIGIDSTSSNSATLYAVGTTAVLNANFVSTAYYRGFPSVGFHTVTWLERSDATATTTFSGDGANSANIQSGMIGTIYG